MKHKSLSLSLALFLLAIPAGAQQYKIAVVGLVHSHVWGHLKEMLQGDQVKLVGIAETEPTLVAEAKKRGAADALFFGDYCTMIKQTKPDIVWGFVENDRHLEIVQFCAPRKIHVMFEKPLASKYADALAIQRLAGQDGIQVMVNYQMAWWPANYAAKNIADSGALGQVWRLRGIVGHGGPGSTGLGKPFFDWLTDPDKNGAGALVDMQCYTALWSLWFLGQPEKVYAQVNHLRPEIFPKVEDNSTMVLSYKNGVGLCEGSWDLPRSFQDLEVFGLKGSVIITQQKIQLQIGRKVQDVPLDPLPPERATPIACLVNAIKSGKALDGLVGLKMNVGVVEILEAARMSVESGQAIGLPLLKPAGI